MNGNEMKRRPRENPKANREVLEERRKCRKWERKGFRGIKRVVSNVWKFSREEIFERERGEGAILHVRSRAHTTQHNTPPLVCRKNLGIAFGCLCWIWTWVAPFLPRFTPKLHYCPPTYQLFHYSIFITMFFIFLLFNFEEIYKLTLKHTIFII